MLHLQAEGRGGAEEAAGGAGATGESRPAGRGGEGEAGGGEEEQGGGGETTEGAKVEGHAGSAGQRGRDMIIINITPSVYLHDSRGSNMHL